MKTRVFFSTISSCPILCRSIRTALASTAPLTSFRTAVVSDSVTLEMEVGATDGDSEPVSSDSALT